MAMLGVATVAIIVAFDATIVSTTLPRVAEALNGMALYAWVGSGYLLATAVTIPVFGRLGDLFGRKRLMLASVVVVALCSIACGLAQSMLQLVIFRTLQGVGGGMMIATAFAAPADLLPDPRQRVRWMALLSASFAVASGVGPILGGTITEWFGWRMAFMVAPLAALPTLYVLLRYFPDLRPSQGMAGRRIDWLGGLLLVVALGAPLGALQYGFSGEGHYLEGALLLGLGLVALAILIPYERRVSVPMLPLRVLASRDARLLNLAALLVGAVMFIMMFYGPLLLQRVLNVTPAAAGLLMTPLVMSIPTASILNGYLFPRQTQPQRLMVLGATLLAAGCAGAMLLDSGMSPNWALLPFALAGLGLGFVLPNLTLFMQVIAERRDVGVASALVQTTRAVGSAAGIAAVGVMISHTSVLTGVRAGMMFSIGCCVVVGILASRVRMRNLR
ncbi:MFS transporter [Achromobacter sp. GG226]|uniref:MFS transporter n=1 Tax=Verticiella alkaliphila TaxID=2779529 RepID=UPI001C0C03F4|nr:MFS transporter [Verticiella sp. GG226]MBU4612001.1 MFS transporter [Verticiella sp. GG226]